MKYLSSVLFIILTGSASLSANTNTIIAEEPLTAPVTSPAYTVTGTITDKTGEPLPGVTVRIRRNPKKSAISDVDGNFTLPDVHDNEILLASYLGFKTVKIRLADGRERYDIKMEANSSVLDEVVVVGYAVQKKVDLTGAISSIGSDALKDRPLTNATNALAGLASGLSVSNSGGNTPGFESQSILVRGQGTLNNSAPLVVVDGMTGIALSDINPQDIENISVLKDAASSAIYGSRAANGVILVTTRQGAEESPRVTYSGNVSFETVAKRLNLVTDYADFMEIQNAGLIANGQAPRFSQGKIGLKPKARCIC